MEVKSNTHLGVTLTSNLSGSQPITSTVNQFPDPLKSHKD